MCGIVAVLHSSLSRQELTQLILKLSKCLRHRGPDWSGICTYRSPESSDINDNEEKGVCASPSSSSIDNGIEDEPQNKSNHRYSSLAHERLAIVDPDSGEQPMKWNLTGKKNDFSNISCLSVNGEIYNHMALKKENIKTGGKIFTTKYEFRTASDCEVVLPLFSDFVSNDEPWTKRMEESIGNKIRHLEGMFAFVIYNSKTGHFLAARDHIGIVPLYMGWGTHDG